MQNFSYIQDAKMIVWKRCAFKIQAETQQQADELAKQLLDSDISPESVMEFPWLTVSPDLSYLFEYEELEQIDPDHMEATIEIYRDGNMQEVLWANGGEHAPDE